MNAVTRSAIIGSVAPAWGTTNSMWGYRATVPLSTRLTTARVVSNRNSSIGRGRPSDVASQHAGDVGWMHHPGVPTVERSEHRLEPRIAQVDAVGVREDAHAVDAERVVGVVDLGERAVDVGQRQRRELTEPGREPLDDPVTRLVDHPGEVARVAVVAEVHSG